MKKAIGILDFETDWDYGLLIRGKEYIDAANTVPIYSLDELRQIQFVGSCGSSSVDETKLFEIKAAIAAILENPKKAFSNLGGNRGAEWTPLNSNIYFKTSNKLKKKSRQTQLLSEDEIKAIRLLLGNKIKYIAWDPNGTCHGYAAKPFKDGCGYYFINEDADPDMLFWDLAQFSFANRAKGQCISINE